MSLTAFALVAASVLCHATWNLLSKRAAVAGTVFVAVWSVVAALIWAPFGIWALVTGWDTLGWGSLVLLGGAALLHTGYYLLLQRGYAVGDLSVVYPVARGLGPVLICAVAVPFFDEDPGLLGWAGTLALSVSVALIGKPSPTPSNAGPRSCTRWRRASSSPRTPCGTATRSRSPRSRRSWSTGAATRAGHCCWPRG
ncbi:hypothetical protein ACFQZ4_33270 [Catellatospora coxensis]